MAIAWFICPYKRETFNVGPFVGRYCAMMDFSPQIKADGGAWSESEVLGNHAIVKVRASAETLDLINAAQGFIRLPKTLLTESLSSLTNAQKTAIVDKLKALGYTITEIRDNLGNNIGNKTLGDVLRFAARRRLKPRYDKDTDTILLDGPEQPVRPIENVDGAII